MSAGISPSRIVRQSIGLEAEGIPMTGEGVCCMCGVHLHVGDLFNKASFSAKFTDDVDMAVRGGHFICGDCSTLMGAVGLRESGYGVFSVGERRPFRKWADIADVLVNPPKPPFVACYATSKNQHMAWRAPVNYSQEAYRVRVGARSLLIRRQRLLDAPAICERVANAISSASGKKPPKSAALRKTLPHPFVSLASDLKDTLHGLLKPSVMEVLKSAAYPEVASDVQWLRTLTVGETWALRFVLTPGAGTPGAEQTHPVDQEQQP